MALRHTTPDGSVRYSTKHQLGSGGEGSVYLGRFQVPGGEIVAVKVGHPGSSPAMFREARVLAAVATHPNVIPKHISVQEGKSKRGIIVSVRPVCVCVCPCRSAPSTPTLGTLTSR